ncbi:MAG: lytic transglycosylase domain-containing protein [Hyphomicrobiaceae bacterium]
MKSSTIVIGVRRQAAAARPARRWRGVVQAVLALAATVMGGAGLVVPGAAQSETVAAQIATASRPPTPAERYRATVRAAIAPLLTTPVSDADKTAIKAAAVAIGRGDLTEGAAIRARIADPVGRKLVDWYRLQRGFATPEEAAAFLAANPDWPDEDTIRRRMEEALFLRPLSADAVIALFAKAPPSSGAGRAALAVARLAKGETEAARRLAVVAWRGDQIPDALEAAFLERLGRLLSDADHKWRFDVILGADRRWASERRARAADARRLLPLLAAGEHQRARARIAVYLRDKSASRLMQAAVTGRPEGKARPRRRAATSNDEAKAATKKAPGEKKTDGDTNASGSGQAVLETSARKSAASDWGFQLQRVQLLRRERKRSEAAAILRRAPVDPALIASLDGWWAEREAVALELMAAREFRAAYQLVRDAGPLSVNPAKDQAFMAGHMALRHLGDKAAAIRHFTAMRKAADGPLSRSRAEHWLARAHAAAGSSDVAAEHFRRGAAYLDTFDGQLSRLAAYPGNRRLEIPLPDAPSNADIERFLGRDVVRAARLAVLSGFSRRNGMTFFARLSHRLTSEAELAMLAELARALGDTQIAVRLGKAAVARGRKLYLYAYPTDVLPAYQPLRQPPETAMLLGIGRQETEFNSQIVSGAGARGLLQVMKVTARHICRDYKVRCQYERLMSDPAYNLQLASAYIADRTDEFGGSYILTLTGYNAGPGRTREWLSKLGDPRGSVAPIDWIQRIPFEETRLYVQKVLSNIQVYRSLLGEAEPLKLDLDMKRGQPVRKGASETERAPG